MTKKLMSLCTILALIVCALMSTQSLFAANNSEGNGAMIPAISFDKQNYSPNDALTLHLKLSNIQKEYKTNSVTFEILYDENSFELAKGNPETDIQDGYLNFQDKFSVVDSVYNSRKAVAMYTNLSDIQLEDNKTVVTINFKVKNNSATGVKTFTLLPVNMFDSSFKIYNVNNRKAYSVNVNVSNSPISTPKTQPNQGNNNVTVIKSKTSPLPTVSPSPTIVSTPTATGKVIETPSKIPGAGSFSDAKNHWAKEYIQRLFQEGVISGYPDNTIKPDNQITRAEMARILVGVLKLKLPENPNTGFADDASIQNWAKGYVQVAKEKGIIVGYPGNVFGPNDKLKRQDMILMIAKAYALEMKNNTSLLDGFADKNRISSYAIDAVSTSVKLEIIKGYADKTIRPLSNVTRAEAFAIICRTADIKQQGGNKDE